MSAKDHMAREIIPSEEEKPIFEGLPAGTIVAYGGEHEPLGWLLCDGRWFNHSQVEGGPVLRNRYVRLYRALAQGWWGDGGDGSGVNLSLPDLRGMFLRGAGTRSDEFAAPDSRRVGKLQSGAMETHHHLEVATHLDRDPNRDDMAEATVRQWGLTLAEATHLYTVGAPIDGSDRSKVYWMTGHRMRTSDSSGSTARETRPMNAAVNWIISY